MKRHNVILESNVESKDNNVLWLQGNKLKKFGNTGWENIVEGDVVTTDRIENGAVTTEKIATNAFDSTLSKSEKIAPANIVGNKITTLNEKVDALALGKFYGYFPDSSSFPTDVSIPVYAYVSLNNSYEIWNFSGESWSDSGVSIDENDVIITTDRIEDGAVTLEKIATSAFDSTLSVSGKIAPADVVGGKLTKLEEEILGELSASVTRYNSFQRRGEIIKHFSSGDKITLSASGTAVSNNIVVRYDDNKTNITILANNGKSSIVTLSKDTTKLIFVCNDNTISVDGTILVKAKFADSIKSIINDVKDELAEEKSRAILSEQTNAANIATLNEQINGHNIEIPVEQIETVADRYLNKLNNRIGTYEGNNLSIIKYAIEKGNTYSVSIAKTCNSAGYVLAYVETLSSLDFVPVIDKLGDRGAYEGSFVSDRNGYLLLGISTDSTSNVVKKITISDSIVNDIEELKRGSVDWSDKKWFVIGDSLSTLNSTTTKRYIDYIVEKTGINVIVRAVGGSSWGQPQLTDAFFKQAFDTPTDTDIVTIFGSFNSWAKREEGVVTDGPSQGKGSVGDDGTDTYYGCVNTCFKNIYDKAPLAKVGVIFPTPWSTQNPFTYNETAETLISVIDSASKKWGIPTLDLFRRSGMRPWDLTYRQLVYSKDSGGIDGNPAGVHPNEIGHEIIATHVLEFMKTLLM